MEQVSKILKNLQVAPDRQSPTGKPYFCDICRDTGFKFLEEKNAVQRCKCWIEKTRARKLLKIPERFANATFASYRPNKYKQPDGKVITLPIAMKGFKRSYFLTGDFGKGKTHLLVAQYRAFTEAGFFQTCFVREVDLLEDLQFQAYREDYTPRWVSLKELERKEYVHFFIDDLGKAKITEDRLYQLFRLIDLIYNKNFGLSLTTNYRIEELEKRWELVDETNGGGIVRRLQDICQPISMFEAIK